VQEWAVDDDEQPAVDSVDDSDSVGDGMTISISASSSKISLGKAKLERDGVRSGGGLENR